MSKYPLDINKWLTRIENLQARLKWSVRPSVIRTWLENFEEKDQEDAFDLLLFFEYISFEELQARFDELLDKIFREVGNDTFVLIVPYGKFGKSGPMIGYPVKNTEAYKKRGSKVDMDWNFLSRSITEKTAVVFIDDFVGSGQTFINHYIKGEDGKEPLKKWVEKVGIGKRYLMSAIMMKSGKANIEVNASDVRIISEFKEKAFDPRLSVYNVINKRSELQKLASSYGKDLGKGPLGYDNSESIIAFAHTTPDNTLGVIWGHERKWNPIFPRIERSRIDQARKLKKEVAFHIGIMNKLGLDLYDQNKSIVTKAGRKILYNHKEDHSLITYIKLKIDRIEDIIICQIIGITINELKDIIHIGRGKGLILVTGEISPEGYQFFNGLIRKVGPHKFRSPTIENIKPANELYLPKQIRGVT